MRSVFRPRLVGITLAGLNPFGSLSSIFLNAMAALEIGLSTRRYRLAPLA